MIRSPFKIFINLRPGGEIFITVKSIAYFTGFVYRKIKLLKIYFRGLLFLYKSDILYVYKGQKAESCSSLLEKALRLLTAQTPKRSDFLKKIAGFEVFEGLRKLLATEQSVYTLNRYTMRFYIGFEF